MKTKRILAIALLTLGGLLSSTALIQAAAFVPGEILVSEISSSSVERYSAGGALLQTFTSLPNASGIALTPDGNLVVQVEGSINGIEILKPDGTPITNFTATGNGIRGDVSVFADGTLALSDQLNNTVQFWSQSGVLLRTVSLASSVHPSGSTVGSDGVLYVVDNGSGRNLARVSAGGILLGNFHLGFDASDLVMDPVDGTLWVSGQLDGIVHHIRTDGTVLGSFDTGYALASPNLRGIGLAPDNNSLFVAPVQPLQNGAAVKHYDLNGNLLGSFPLPSFTTHGYLTVVPNTGPEPTSAALLALSALALATRRRRNAGGE